MLNGLSTPENVSLIEKLEQKFYEADGLVHMSTSGETTWHGFASAIIDGLRARGISVAVKDLVPIETKDFPAKATRPRETANSWTGDGWVRCPRPLGRGGWQ